MSKRKEWVMGRGPESNLGEQVRKCLERTWSILRSYIPECRPIARRRILSPFRSNALGPRDTTLITGGAIWRGGGHVKEDLQEASV